MKRRLPSIFNNAITMFGMTFATVMFILALILIAFDIFGGFANAYSGLVTYIALPGLMFLGLGVAAIGLIIERRRQKKGLATATLPVLDLNQPRGRATATSIAVGGLLLMAISGFGSYKGYEYTESVEFCGTTCHSLMEPEHVAYQNSPHARVSCAGCHIGEGVDWYVKSKLSGTYQVYSTIFNKYERPIKTPIANLRPAQETCEKCHWPKHFFSQKLRMHDYYLSDPDNTHAQVGMLVKIGGGEGPEAQGIHAHMYLNSTVSYIASDFERQEIPYVEMVDKDGKVTKYWDKTVKFGPNDVAKGVSRKVDCIDCHNRPTHIFHPSDESVNLAISAGTIDRAVPEIKMKGVEALDAKYATKEEGLSKILETLKAYYKENYAEFMAKDGAKLDKAIAELQKIYRNNYFPAMNTDWRSHRNNLDHLRGNGCFRCHNGRLKSDTGRVISNDCNTCHTFVAHDNKGNMKGVEFQHPVDIGDEWKTTPCKDCHGYTPEEPGPAKE
ncbi:MAG: NapC/NirT family cytochrome c [Fimbriimonadaceae bacterium]|nr:NapC/NirT family cytochrome c [Fimbriimonadaceae bacterium]QYK55058.1 MAG: NapC/NirT family cytochrome c [Fimbriimonadaceae bacterium]